MGPYSLGLLFRSVGLMVSIGTRAAVRPSFGRMPTV